jgi:hypothetical protein
MTPFNEDLALTMQCMHTQVVRLRDDANRVLFLCPVRQTPDVTHQADYLWFWLQHDDHIYVGRYPVDVDPGDSSFLMPDSGYFEDFVAIDDVASFRLTLCRSHTTYSGPNNHPKHMRVFSQEFLEARRLI